MKRISIGRAGCAALVTLVGLAATSQLSTGAVAAEPTVEELLQRLEEREALIDRLSERVDDLERRVDAVNRAGVMNAALPASGVVSRGPGAMSGNVASAPIQRQAAQGQSPQNQSAQGAAPGQFEVDEDAAERALERSLTAEGALLLPAGLSEIEPSFTYTRRESDVGVLFGPAPVVGGTQRVERNEFTASLDYRLGLPYGAQLEIGIPYHAVDQSTVNQTALGNISQSDASGSAVGDLRIGVAKTLLREGGWRPDLLARVTYDSNTGEGADNNVSLNGGFHEVRGELTALKRQDPIAFVGTISYEKSFQDNNVDPGDEYGLSLQALLAASPDTSLRLGLQQTFIGDLERGGNEVPGSDQVQSTAIFGVSSILGRGVFLDFSAGIGLTEDAPDYFVGLSLPIRFNTPFIQ